jgi:hypothetical protein
MTTSIRRPEGCRAAVTIDAPSSRRSSVEAFLETVLASGCITVAELDVKAKAAGLISDRQSITSAKRFKLAKRNLHLRSVRRGFGPAGAWCWALPSPSDPTRSAPSGDSPLELPQPVAGSSVHQSALTVGSVAAAADLDVGPNPVAAQINSGHLPNSDRQLWKVGNFSAAWIDGVGRLTRRKPPTSVLPHRWSQFLDDCDRFLGGYENWGARASDLGWTSIDLFGCRRGNPLGFPSLLGLIWRLGGSRLTKLQRDWAQFERASDGAQQVFHRRVINARDVTLPWRSG